MANGVGREVHTLLVKSRLHDEVPDGGIRLVGNGVAHKGSDVCRNEPMQPDQSSNEKEDRVVTWPKGTTLFEARGDIGRGAGSSDACRKASGLEFLEADVVIEERIGGVEEAPGSFPTVERKILVAIGLEDLGLLFARKEDALVAWVVMIGGLGPAHSGTGGLINFTGSKGSA